MGTPISGISSMATRQLLADLVHIYHQQTRVDVDFESVGGVDAAKRVQAGEAFDVVALASDAIDRLIAAGSVVAGSRTDLVRSGVAVAVRAGASRPDVSTEQALRSAVLSARSVGYSTGPSGVALAAMFERWGIAEEIRPRIVLASPGVPVGRLIAEGEVELGFQQYSELMHLPGIDILGPMPPGCGIVTTFSAGLCATSTQADGVRALLAFLSSPAVADAKRRNGMEPA
jgi:molybdate transport system substrate-binding protein